MEIPTSDHQWWDQLMHWADNKTRHLHVTIQDILDIEPGETRVFLCLDRNFGEIIGDGPYEGNPGDILRDGYHMVFTKGKLKNSIKPAYMEIACGLDEANTLIDNMNISMEDSKHSGNTELHIEYKPKCWYPLINNVFHVFDPQILEIYGEKKRLLDGEDRTWEEFPLSTRVGWRGAMIPLDKVNNMLIA